MMQMRATFVSVEIWNIITLDLLFGHRISTANLARKHNEFKIYFVSHIVCVAYLADLFCSKFDPLEDNCLECSGNHFVSSD